MIYVGRWKQAFGGLFCGDIKVGDLGIILHLHLKTGRYREITSQKKDLWFELITSTQCVLCVYNCMLYIPPPNSQVYVQYLLTSSLHLTEHTDQFPLRPVSPQTRFESHCFGILSATAPSPIHVSIPKPPNLLFSASIWLRGIKPGLTAQQPGSTQLIRLRFSS